MRRPPRTTPTPAASSPARSKRRCTSVRPRSPTTRNRASGPRPISCIPTGSRTRRAGCTCSPTCRNTARSGPSRSNASQDISLLEERFTPIEELPDEAFPHSLGVHSGPPERVEIEFEPAVADYVRAPRVASVADDRRPRRRRRRALTLDVCLDRALTQLDSQLRAVRAGPSRRRRLESEIADARSPTRPSASISR